MDAGALEDSYIQLFKNKDPRATRILQYIMPLLKSGLLTEDDVASYLENVTPAKYVETILPPDCMAFIFEHYFTAEKAAHLLDNYFSNDYIKGIFSSGVLSETKGNNILNAMTNSAKKLIAIGTFEYSFGTWNFDNYDTSTVGGGWEQVSDYVYSGYHSGRLYGGSHNEDADRQYEAKVYVTGKGLASRKLRVKTYVVDLYSADYGSGYGLYAKFGDYAIYWEIEYHRNSRTPAVAGNVTKRNTTVTDLGGGWKQGETDVSIADAFNAASYPVPTEDDTIEVGIVIYAWDGSSSCNKGSVDIRVDDFEVV